jgi:hypothetical protein
MNRVLTPKSYPLIDADLDRFDVFTKQYTQYVGDKLTTVGLRIGEKPNHVVAFFGDRVLIRPNGTYTVQPAVEMSSARWNYLHKVGTPVIAYPCYRGCPNDPPLTTRTRSVAWDVCGEPVVKVDGYAGGIALTHIDVVDGAL